MRTPSLILTALLATSSVAFAQNGYPQPYNPQDPQNYGSPAGQQYQQYDQNGYPIQQQDYPPQGGYQQQPPYPQQGDQQQGGYQQQGDDQNYDNGQQAYEESQEAPPALPEYSQPEAPGYGYIWTPGYWAYTPYGYQWVPGAWVLPPYQNALWTPGYWGFNNDLYFWNPGYWGTEVGYYGGIDYGFGYFGDGFYGGGWNNGIFFYNAAYWNCGRYDRYRYDRDDWREVREEHERRGDRDWVRAYGNNHAHLDHGVFHPSAPAFAHVDHLQPAQRAALVRGQASIGQGHMLANRNEATVAAHNQQGFNGANRRPAAGPAAGPASSAPITRGNAPNPAALNHNQQTFNHANVRNVPAPAQTRAAGSPYAARPQQQQQRPFNGGFQRPAQTYTGAGYPHSVYQQQQNQQRAQQTYQQRPQLQYRPQQQQQYRPQQQQQYRPQPQQQFHAAPQPQFHSAPQPSFHAAAPQGGGGNHGGHR